MQRAFDEALGTSWREDVSPPLHAYGLTPGQGGYRLADLRSTANPDGQLSEGVYSEFAVALVLGGAFEYAGEAGKATAVPGSFVFANRSEGFTCRHLSAEPNRRLVLFLAGEMIEAAAEDLPARSARLPQSVAPPSRLTPGVSAGMLRIARGSADSEEAALAIVESAFRGGDQPVATETASARIRRPILDTVRHINAHFAEPCTLDDLAAIAGLSRFRFARRFRAVTGETANQYVLNRRLSAAALRLAATRDPVTEIAYGTGFNDLSYFYARFRAAFGAAPGTWRRAHAA